MTSLHFSIFTTKPVFLSRFASRVSSVSVHPPVAQMSPVPSPRRPYANRQSCDVLDGLCICALSLSPSSPPISLRVPIPLSLCLFISVSLALSELDHPSVVKLIEVFNSDTHVFMAMEAVDGQELYAEINRKGMLEEHRARDLFHQVNGGFVKF